MRLRDEYTGVVDALPDVTVGSDVTGTLHRPDGDGDAWCNSLDDAAYFETEIALAYGAELCRGCFRASLEHLARSEESPVRRVDGLDDEPSADRRGRPRDHTRWAPRVAHRRRGRLPRERGDGVPRARRRRGAGVWL